MAKSRRAPDEDVRRRRPDDDEADAPRRKGRRDDDEEDEADDAGPIKPRRKKKSAAGPAKIVFRIIAAVLGAIALVVFLVWVYTPVGCDSSMLCYFPKETTYLQGYDFDEVTKNAKMTEVHQQLLNNYKLFGDRRWNDQTGVKETDVLRYMHGRASGDPEEEKDLPEQQKRGELTVIRFKAPVDEAKFVASFTGFYQCREDTAKDGRKFYQLWYKRRVPPDNHEEEAADVSFFFPNSKTLVYGTTRRELTEAMTRSPGRVVLEGTMKELANDVDGHYFSASAGSVGFEGNGVSYSIAFGLGFVDEEFKDTRKFNGVVGTANWFASNGNDFLYASAQLYGDARTAREVRRKLSASYTKAQEQIYQSDSGKPGGLTDPFNPPQPKGQGGSAFGTTSTEQTADVIDALAEYSKSARVRVRGRLVIIEGLIPHGHPETGVFEKFWSAISSKFMVNQYGAGRFGPGGMGPGMGPGMGGGMPGGMPAPGGVPVGPGR